MSGKKTRLKRSDWTAESGSDFQTVGLAT